MNEKYLLLTNCEWEKAEKFNDFEKAKAKYEELKNACHSLKIWYYELCVYELNETTSQYLPITTLRNWSNRPSSKFVEEWDNMLDNVEIRERTRNGGDNKSI